MVVVECYADSTLVTFLGVPSKALRHERGKGRVLNRLEQKKGEHICGLIDQDPGSTQPGRLQRYKADQDEHDLALLRHVEHPSVHLIVVKPRLEEWSISRAKACGLHLPAYGLPANGAGLHAIPRYDRRDGFHRLLRDLAEDEGMVLLQKWLRSYG